MKVLGTATRLVALAGLLWALGSLGAAINWHGTWTAALSSSPPGSAAVLEAQERWQHWVDMTLVGFAVVITAVVAAVWLVLHDPGRRWDSSHPDHPDHVPR